MVERWRQELNRKFANVETDEYVIMPNHFHGIVVIADSKIVDTENDPDGRDVDTENDPDVGADLRVCPNSGPAMEGAPTTGAHADAPLPTIVQWFKTMTTNEYVRGVKSLGWPVFASKLRQRNYYEHIIRNDVSLGRIRQYIADNPAQWALDRENPAFPGTGKDCDGRDVDGEGGATCPNP